MLVFVWLTGVLFLVHKRMSNLGFEGLQVTFEALMNLSTPTHN